MPRIKPPFGPIDWSHPIARGLSAAYLLHEGAGAKVHDAIAPSNPIGTLSSGVTWSRDARGVDLAFNGSSGSVDFTASAPGLTVGTGDFSVLAISAQSTFSHQVIVSKQSFGGSGNPSGWLLHALASGSGGIVFDINVAGLGQLTASDGSDGRIYDGQPHAIAGTIGRLGNLRRYLDGSPFGTAAAVTGGYQSANISDGTIRALIGARDAGSGNELFHAGRISAVFAWRRELSPAEVAWASVEPFAIFRIPSARRFSLPTLAHHYHGSQFSLKPLSGVH